MRGPRSPKNSIVAILHLSILTGIVFAVGCGGARPDLGPLSQQFEYLRRDTRALDPQPPASLVLAAGEEKYARAEALQADRKEVDAQPLLTRAVADARLALAAARARRAEVKAAECSGRIGEARQQWDEAMRGLTQTERISGRSTSVVPREDPGEAYASESADADRPFSLENTDPPNLPAGDLSQVWRTALAEAKGLDLPTADLESRFDAALSLLHDPKIKEPQKAEPTYLAGRTIEEIQARSAEARADQRCDDAPAVVGAYSARRDEALRATLELERGLQTDLRGQLEQARLDAARKQTELYDALASLQGKFATITRDARGTIVSLADILFDFDKATLKRDVEFNLVKVATILGQFPEMKIQVEGHTDNVGKPDYNLDLSRRRAKAVYEFVSSQGVDAGRMVYDGFGMTNPVADNSTDAGRAKNRRVDLIIPDMP